MTFSDKNIYNRRSIRLKNYNYAERGAYFLTICTKHKQRLFGNIKQDKICLNQLGKIAFSCWQEIPQHFPYVNLDVFVIMPNHVHGILWITKSVNDKFNPRKFGKMTKGSISNVVRSYKAIVTKKINQICQQQGTSLIWQRNFYEHIIRDEKALNNIREYIVNNPLNWHNDPDYSDSKEILLDLPF